MSDDRVTHLLAVARVTERVLASRWSGTVTVGNITLLTLPERKYLVLRCWLSEAPADAPPTVIVKQAGTRGYDPDDPTSPAWQFWWTGSKRSIAVPLQRAVRQPRTTYPSTRRYSTAAPIGPSTGFAARWVRRIP